VSQDEPLVAAAKAAARNAWCKYSGFHVGAALLAEDGRVFTGCNVENASYGLTVCAERNAVFKAVSEGVTRFRRIAIYCPTPEPSVPCGACRQVLAEFAPALEIVLCCDGPGVRQTSLDRLFPDPFLL
jgi:cytidine deaminase